MSFKGKYGPLLIAEIGGNHEGNFEYAEKLVNLAIKSGVDCVKMQIYSGDGLVSPIESPDRNAHFKRFELTREQHEKIAQSIKNAGLCYTASVWDLDAIKWAEPLLDFFKVGSGDLTAYPILERIAQTNKPIILSTGLSTEMEVLETVKFLQSINSIYRAPDYLALLQCTSMYPIRNEDANLNVMGRLKELTGLTVGYSDHTEGTKALQYAVAMGAEILEFHFTDSRDGKSFRDHKVSLMTEEIQSLIQEIELIHKLQGHFVKQPLEIEIEQNHHISFRRAIYPAKDMPIGHVIKEEDLVVLRPNHGVDARNMQNLLGKALVHKLNKFEKIYNEYIKESL